MSEYTAQQIAELVNGTVAGDPERKITGVNSLTLAGKEEASFLSTIKFRKKFETCKAGIVLIGKDMKLNPSGERTLILCEDADAAFSKLCGLFTPEPIHYEPGVCPGAYVHPTAKLGQNVYVGPNASIMEGAEIGDNTRICAGAYVGHFVKIGKDCQINPNVTIMHRCILGDRVILHGGVTIGGDGFGYTPSFRGLIKVPQNGYVQLDSDVEIGANSTVDRARFGKTWIKKGAKIDNLVQVGHNVIIGESSVMIAQSGVAGSAELGRGVLVAAQSGVNGHITMGDGSRVVGASAVQKSVPPGVTVFGTPAETQEGFFERHSLPIKVRGLVAKIAKLEAELAALKENK